MTDLLFEIGFFAAAAAGCCIIYTTRFVAIKDSTNKHPSAMYLIRTIYWIWGIQILNRTRHQRQRKAIIDAKVLKTWQIARKL